MAYSITKKELTPQPVLVVRRQLNRSEIAATLAEVFGQVFLYAQQTGTTLAGPPFTRFVERGPGLITIEAGMPVAAVREDPHRIDSGIAGAALPGGSVATTTHFGPYEKLPEAYAAIQAWIEAEGFGAAGAPWESYITDPGNYPDPKDWKTEVFQPLAP